MLGVEQEATEETEGRTFFSVESVASCSNFHPYPLWRAVLVVLEVIIVWVG